MQKIGLAMSHIAIGLTFLILACATIDAQPQIEEERPEGEGGPEERRIEGRELDEATVDEATDLQNEVRNAAGQLDQLTQRIEEEQSRVDALRNELGGEKSIFRFGVSMGPRILRLKPEEKVDFIDPFLSGVYQDSLGNRTLQIDRTRDKSSWLISAVLGITPGRNLENDGSTNFGHFFRSRSTFILNVNLSTLANSMNASKAA